MLDSASLTQTSGAGTLASTLANVSTRADPPRSRSDLCPRDRPNLVTGQLGIDNIRALPEPGALAQLGAGIAALWLGQRFARIRDPTRPRGARDRAELARARLARCANRAASS